MKTEDLAVLSGMPFLFWAKSADGVYLWGNDTINRFAGSSVIGKTDRELPWADTADMLVAHDNSVLDSGKPGYTHEVVHKSALGQSTLNVCNSRANWTGCAVPSASPSS